MEQKRAESTRISTFAFLLLISQALLYPVYSHFVNLFLKTHCDLHNVQITSSFLLFFMLRRTEDPVHR